MCACIHGQEEVLLHDICKINIRRLVIGGLRCRVCVCIWAEEGVVARCKIFARYLQDICKIFARHLQDICETFVRYT